MPQNSPKVDQRVARGPQRVPNRAQRVPSASQRVAKGRPKGSQSGPKVPQWLHNGPHGLYIFASMGSKASRRTPWCQKGTQKLSTFMQNCVIFVSKNVSESILPYACICATTALFGTGLPFQVKEFLSKIEPSWHQHRHQTGAQLEKARNRSDIVKHFV